MGGYQDPGLLNASLSWYEAVALLCSKWKQRRPCSDGLGRWRNSKHGLGLWKGKFKEYFFWIFAGREYHFGGGNDFWFVPRGRLHCPFISLSLSPGVWECPSTLPSEFLTKIPEGRLSQLLLDFSENIFWQFQVSPFKTRRLFKRVLFKFKSWKRYCVYQSRGFDFSTAEWFIPPTQPRRSWGLATSLECICMATVRSYGFSKLETHQSSENV